MKAPQLTDLLAFQVCHVALVNWVMTCQHCGQTCKSAKRSQSLANHIYTYSGFVNMHKDCKPGEPSEVAKLLAAI